MVDHAAGLGIADHGRVRRSRRPTVGARNVCEAMDLDLLSNNINNVRIETKRLTGRGILAETEPGLLARPRP